MKRTPAIMLQGTGSDVGKSLLLAGLGRAYTRRGLTVRPFKPQNMSNNAAVAADGGEIGRAQALQARACKVDPSVHMNPVLLKPQSETGAQIVVHGRVWRNARAAEYHNLKPDLLPKVLESFERQRQSADLVLVEGAGSPAEINLRDGDIANMGFAEAADVPVLLVGDIERGGVIAGIVGTQMLLEPAERARLKGYVVNKFRGDPRLFDEGLRILTARSGLPSLGVVPYFPAARMLPAEDGMALASWGLDSAKPRAIRVAVPRLAHISNFDDLDPLRAEPDVNLVLVPPGHPLPGDADLVILPGSKATIADLEQLRAEGWDLDLRAHARRGGWVLGLCGGFQMLGRRIADPTGLEGPARTVDGLGLLDFETVITPEKTLLRINGRDLASGESVDGYEMHMGRSAGPALASSMLQVGGRPDGARAGRVLGCYVHGLFAADGFRHAFLNAIKTRASSGLLYEDAVEKTLDALADHLEAHLDLNALLEIARAR